MFVVIINFPPIKAGKDAEFRQWFTDTNEEFGNFKGFIARRLLKPMTSGNYVAIVEHESQESFMAMHESPAHNEAGKRVGPLLDGTPSPQFYEMTMQIINHPKELLAQENCRINELLSEQIAVIQGLAPQLNMDDMKLLEANLDEIELALNKLKEFMEYLPK